MLDMLFKPIKIGNVELKNRLAVPPMVSNFCTDDGQVTERLIRYHEERAKGGWGLITIEQTVVSKAGKGHPNQPAIWGDEYIEGLFELTQRVHAAGAKISVQLNHAGRSSNVSITGRPLQGPSVLKDPQRTDMPVELTIEEIHEIVRQFGAAALRAKKAGFDMVTEHAHARYLIASFLSPISNKRTDEYGGPLINRARFAVEVLKSMREKAGPDFPIIYRFSADEFVEGGLTLGDTLAFAQIIEEAGADALDVSVGNAFSTQYITAPSVVPHAFIADITAQFKKAVSIPVAV
ncbi:MAG: NADH:flavin oxidoreductase, partial [Desulfobacterales bacterium]